MLEGSRLGGISLDLEDGAWVVTLTGEHDLATVQEFRRTLDGLLNPEELALARPTLVIIDLSVVEFIDSSVINAILRAHDLVDDDPHVHLAVVAGEPDRFAARVLDMVGVSRIVPTYASRAQALSALSSPPAPG